MFLRTIAFTLMMTLSASAFAAPGDPAVASEENGKFLDADGNPTYKVFDDKSVDWYTWRGFKKYNANCMQCHGPDGVGSSFAPDLTNSLKTIDYSKFMEIVSSGQQNVWHPVNSIMPAWGSDLNVMCFADSIYAYLRGRATGDVGRGEIKRNGPVNEAAKAEENACLGF
ncbi:c-type cytochrome, methanol metabolism-related [Chthonobacter rhizosphaerae]|uniref:c-type cytochrome, methanol metabolism-related n=1 Tax=Chthonobacter rhizosphaerae TaxID=2735553 RepID=UPI001FE5FDC2|nr:c-type cytochrome, methanol metabolism-related [Chthonobacter rhizosphaerae]